MAPIIKLDVAQIKDLIIKNLGGKKIADYPQEKVFKAVREVCYKEGKHSLFVNNIEKHKVLITKTKKKFEQSEKVFRKLLDATTGMQTSKEKMSVLKELEPKFAPLRANSVLLQKSYNAMVLEKKQITADRTLAFNSTKEKIARSKGIITKSQKHLQHIEDVINQIDTDWKILFNEVVYNQTKRHFNLKITRSLFEVKTVANLSYNFNFQKNKDGHWDFINDTTDKILRESFIDDVIITHEPVYNKEKGFLALESSFALVMDKLDLANKTTKGATHLFSSEETEEWEKEDIESLETYEEFISNSKKEFKDKQETTKNKSSWGLSGAVGLTGSVKVKSKYESEFTTRFTKTYSEAWAHSYKLINTLNLLHEEVLNIKKEDITITNKTAPKKSVDPKAIRILRKINKLKNILKIFPLPKKLKFLRKTLNIFPVFRGINKLFSLSDGILKIYDFFKKPKDGPVTIEETNNKLHKELQILQGAFKKSLNTIELSSGAFKSELSNAVKITVTSDLELKIGVDVLIAAKGGFAKGNEKTKGMTTMNINVNEDHLNTAEAIYTSTVNEYEEKVTKKQSTQNSSKTTESKEKDLVVKGNFLLKLLCYTNKEGKLDLRFDQSNVSLIKNGLVHSPDLRFDFVLEDHLSGVSN